MKRDLDLIREILKKIEALPDAICPYPTFFEIPPYDKKTISYHIRLLGEVGYIEAREFSGAYTPIRLTWDGHEFLAASSDDTRWEKAKAKLLTVGGVTFPVLLEFLSSIARSQIGLP